MIEPVSNILCKRVVLVAEVKTENAMSLLPLGGDAGGRGAKSHEFYTATEASSVCSWGFLDALLFGYMDELQTKRQADSTAPAEPPTSPVEELGV
jgi:hypothetical protein